MTHIEQSCVPADGLIFIHYAGILDGHFPACKVDEFALGFAVSVDEGCLFHQVRLTSTVVSECLRV